MGVALTGFLTGFAKGAKERIDTEREENEALIENRLKMAQTNRLLRQKEVAAQKELLNGRLSSVSSYLPADATEEQKLALVSNEEIAKQFVELSKNEKVDLDKFLIVNKDKIPTNFSSVKQYIDSISAAPTPVGQEQIDAIRQTRGFLGARTGANIEKAASQFGASASELLAYEQPQEIESLPDFARMNTEMLRPKKDGDDRLKDAEIAVFESRDKFGEDSPEFKQSVSQFAMVKALQSVLNPDPETFAKRLDRALLAVDDATTPEDKKIAQDRLNELRATQRDPNKDINPEGATLPQQRAMFKSAVTTALSLQFPRYKEGIVQSKDPLTGETNLQAISSDEKISADLRNVELGALRELYERFYSDKETGLPKSAQTAQLLASMGVQFDESGRPIFKVDVPPTAPDPNKPTRTNPAAARTPPAPAATPAAAAPAATKTSGQTASGKITQAPAAPAAAAGDTYRFENLNPSQVEAVVKASGTGEGLNPDGVQRLLTNKDDFNSLPLETRKRWFAAMNKLAPSSAPTNVRNFRSVEEAEAANLPKGTRITINGRRAEVQ